MSERDNESFDLDEEFLAEAEDNTDYDRILDKVERRVRAQPGTPNAAKLRGAGSRKSSRIVGSRKI